MYAYHKIHFDIPFRKHTLKAFTKKEVTKNDTYSGRGKKKKHIRCLFFETTTASFFPSKFFIVTSNKTLTTS
jgi:hypothetical protein